MNTFSHGSVDFFPTVFPLALIAMGLLLRACTTRHRLIVEEQVKIRLMTETEARREIRMVSWAAPAMIFTGFVYAFLLRLDVFY